MTAAQLALDCDPTWDPEPDDEDNGPWCRYRPGLINDLWGQGLFARHTSTITTVPLTGSYL